METEKEAIEATRYTSLGVELSDQFPNDTLAQYRLSVRALYPMGPPLTNGPRPRAPDLQGASERLSCNYRVMHQCKARYCDRMSCVRLSV